LHPTACKFGEEGFLVEANDKDWEFLVMRDKRHNQAQTGNLFNGNIDNGNVVMAIPQFQKRIYPSY
jgi:hypothetical protein